MKSILVLLITIKIIQSIPIENKSTRTPTLMISLDGFRADKLDKFLRENPNSHLQKEFVEVGVKADYMLPSFPTLTFPNHFTIVTGLYMESHDIVGNSVYDSVYNQKMNFLRDSGKNDVKWWNKSEPIWLTAKKQGLKTSSFFWAGSEVWQRHPDIFLIYNEDYKYKSRCDEVVNWYKKFNLDFGTLYFDEPDHTGHSNGPESEEYAQAIKNIDETIGYLMNKLRESNILDHLNVVVVSDHGMAAMNNKTIFPKDYVDMNLIDSTKTIYGIVSNIYPKNDSVKQTVYDSLKKAKNLTVYFKEQVPESFHFQNSNRIAPIVAVADEGYVMNTAVQTLAGNHGFDNSIESMRAIFLARGPDFKKNVKLNPIKNVDVYPMLCKILNIQCRPNNGTIDALLPGLNLTSRYSKLKLNI